MGEAFYAVEGCRVHPLCLGNIMVLLNIRGILSSKDFHETLNHKFVIPFQSSTSTQCGVPSSVYATKSNNKHLFSSFGSNLKKGGDVLFPLLVFSVLNGSKTEPDKKNQQPPTKNKKQRKNNNNKNHGDQRQRVFFNFSIMATFQGITMEFPVSDSCRCPVVHLHHLCS